MNKDLIEATSSFIEIAKKGSITLTSEAMNISANTLHKRLAFLEEYLNKKLLISHSEGYSLSDDGWQYFYSMQPIWDEFEDKAHIFYKGQKDRKLIYRILCPMQSAVYLARFLLKDISDTCSNYYFEVMSPPHSFSLSSDTHFQNLATQCDILILNLSLSHLLNLDDWTVVVEPKVTKLKLYASREYINEIGGISAVEDLNGLNFITRADSKTKNGKVKLKQNNSNECVNIQFKVSAVVDFDMAKFELINQGAGIGLIEQSLLSEEVCSNLVELFPEFIPDANEEAMILAKNPQNEVTKFFQEKAKEIITFDHYLSSSI